MKDVLCIYYSRTGNTKKAMEEIAGELGAEVVELRDDTDRTGWRGWLRCGLDAMRKTTCPLQPFETERPLDQYRLVILGTPVWAGRCSSVMRAFLKENGQKLKNVAYVVYGQMDLYTPCGHQAAVSLRSGSVGYAFWQEEFLRQVREALAAR